MPPSPPSPLNPLRNRTTPQIKQHYFVGDGYMELDLDVGSDAVAKKITGVAYSYAKVRPELGGLGESGLANSISQNAASPLLI